jgi:ankyrin repeat protein
LVFNTIVFHMEKCPMRSENELKWMAVLNSPREGAACRELLQSGFDPNERVERGGTPIIEAAGRGQLETCKTLIAAGADVKLSDEKGCTALHFAATNGHDDVCKLLLDHGANVEAVTSTDGGTPLHWAAGRAAAAAVLLAAGASVHAVANWNIKPLHEAVHSNDEDVCRLMLAAGADPVVRPGDYKGDYFSPLETAVSAGKGAIVRVLAEGRDIDFFQPNVAGVALIDLVGANADDELVAFAADIASRRTEGAIYAGLEQEARDEAPPAARRASLSPF